MSMMRRRLEALEEKARFRRRDPSSKARERMVEHLDRLAKLRRGDLDPGEAAEVRATDAALRSRLAMKRGTRGEGIR